MKKQTISLVLVVCLMGSSVPAMADVADGFKKGFGKSPIGQMSDFVQNGDGGGDYYSNITSPSADADGIYGGDIEFRVNATSAEYKPWVDFQTPKIKTGCGGMSLSAGFLEGISLEDLSEQLGNAAGALTYGVLIAIVNSVPTIEHVFSKIKEVAQHLQGVLKNTCNIGVALGNKAKDNLGIKDGWGIQAGVDTIKRTLDDGGGAFEKEMDRLLSDATSTGAGKEANQTEATSNYEALFFEGEHSALIIPQRLTENKLTNGWYGVSRVEIRGENNLEFLYLMAVNIFGARKVATQELQTFFGEKVGGTKISQFMAEGKLTDKTPEEKALKDNIINATKAFKDGNVKAFDAPLKDDKNAILPSRSSTKLIQDLLGTDSKNANQATIELRSVWIYESIVKTPKKMYQMMIPIHYGEKVNVKWAGIYNESLKRIKECTQNQKSNKPNASTCGSGVVPLVVPNAGDYINTISEIIAKSKSPNQKISAAERITLQKQADDLTVLLAKMNSYFVAQYFLEHIMNYRVEGTAGVSAAEDTESYVRNVKLLETYLKKIEEEVFDKRLKAMSGKSIFDEFKKKFQVERNEKQTSGGN